jgi:hypothetical protein
MDEGVNPTPVTVRAVCATLLALVGETDVTRAAPGMRVAVIAGATVGTGVLDGNGTWVSAAENGRGVGFSQFGLTTALQLVTCGKISVALDGAAAGTATSPRMMAQSTTRIHRRIRAHLRAGS